MKKIIITLAIIVNSSIVSAESPKAEDYTGRLPVETPQSAGFAILGVSPDKVIDPQSGKELGAALLHGLDASGHFQSGFSLETRPFLWNKPKYTSQERTIADTIKSGFKLTLASTSGLDDKDKANRYGMGINWSYQFNDPLFNIEYLQCIKDANNNAPKIPPQTKQELDAVIDILKTESSKCIDKHTSWTTTALSFGTAGHKAKEQEKNISSSGFGIWLTGSYAIKKDLEILMHGRYVNNQLKVVDGNLSEVDENILSMRVRYGTQKIRGILEASWNKEETTSINDSYNLVSAGVEFEVSKDIWFRLAYGDTIGSSTSAKEFFTGQLRFGLGNSPLSKL